MIALLCRGSTATELHHCSGSYRITPTDVNSRQSSCLTNFLLSGRSVMLEMVKRTSNTKIISHMLTSHGGEIFIHTLSCCRYLKDGFSVRRKFSPLFPGQLLKTRPAYLKVLADESLTTGSPTWLN